MRDHITTFLDALGLLLVAAGLGVAVAALIGPGSGLIVAGLVVLAGSQMAAAFGARGRRP